MIHAYEPHYLDDAMRNLGEAFDYAVNDCGFAPDEFRDMFIVCGVAEQFESGAPKYVAGMSGTELVWEITCRCGRKLDLPEPGVEYECSPEYWSGWILAYYQWFTGRSFKEIFRNISMEEILKLYPTLHEASEEKFVDTVERIIRRANPSTQLQRLRRALGYSQKELAKKSGVSLRMIQQYEQRAKDINKATGVNLIALAQELGCRMEDLMESEISDDTQDPDDRITSEKMGKEG